MSKVTEGDAVQQSGKMLQVNEGELHKHLQGVVIGTVKETLNCQLEVEADRSVIASNASAPRPVRHTCRSFTTARSNPWLASIEG